MRKADRPIGDPQGLPVYEKERDYTGRETGKSKLMRTVYVHRGCELPSYIK